jgi:hypothetical protein
MQKRYSGIGIFAVLFSLIFVLAGLQVALMGIVPAEVSCRFKKAKAACEIKAPAFLFRTKTAFLKDAIKADIKRVRRSKRNTDKLILSSQNGATADIEQMSSNMGYEHRRAAQIELNALLAKGDDFTFKYKSGGAVLFGIVFISAGLIFTLIFLSALMRKQPLQNEADNIYGSEPKPENNETKTISEREYKLLLFTEKIRRHIGTAIKLSGIFTILFICFFIYKVFSTISSERKSDKANAAAISMPAAAERKPYYFYIYGYSPIDERIDQRIKTAVNNLGHFYKKPHSPQFVGYSGNNVYFKTIPMTEEEKDDFLDYMDNRIYFNIGGPSYAKISDAMLDRPADIKVDENLKRIRVNMGDQSAFIIEAASEAGDPEMENSKITSTYYDIKDLKIHVNEEKEVIVDIYFYDMQSLSGFFNTSFQGDPIIADDKGITDTLPEDLRQEY